MKKNKLLDLITSVSFIFLPMLFFVLTGCKGKDGDDGKVFLTADWNSVVQDSPSYIPAGGSATAFIKNEKKEMESGTYTLTWKATNNYTYT